MKPVCNMLCGTKNVDSHHIKLNSVCLTFTSISQHGQPIQSTSFTGTTILLNVSRGEKNLSQEMQHLELQWCRLHCKNNCKISIRKLGYSQSAIWVLLSFTSLHLQVFLHLTYISRYRYCKRSQGCNTCWKLLRIALLFAIQEFRAYSYSFSEFVDPRKTSVNYTECSICFSKLLFLGSLEILGRAL